LLKWAIHAKLFIKERARSLIMSNLNNTSGLSALTFNAFSQLPVAQKWGLLITLPVVLPFVLVIKGFSFLGRHFGEDYNVSPEMKPYRDSVSVLLANTPETQESERYIGDVEWGLDASTHGSDHADLNAITSRH